MNDEVYEKLAAALDKLPNGFPRTPSNVEIPMLKKIFSQEEATVVCQLTGTMESVDSIAERAGEDAKQLQSRLMKLAKRGVVWFSKKDGKAHFRLAPFVVGIYEAQLENMDHEFAHLVEEYMADGGAAGIMKPQPALHRVVPAHGSVKSEYILPYEDVRAMLEKGKSFRVLDCICRVQQDQLGKRKCDFPVKNCVTFATYERPARPDDITKEQAIEILDTAEEVGLVHTVSNSIKSVFYVCNCCGCCCGILRGITDWGIEKSVAYANYFAVINPDTCTGCGVCLERCQVKAISENEGVSVVNREKCIGCGLCVSGCPENAAQLEPRLEAERIEPPEDFAAWERARLKDRGLAE